MKTDRQTDWLTDTHPTENGEGRRWVGWFLSAAGRVFSSDTVAKTFVWDGDQPVGGNRKTRKPGGGHAQAGREAAE